MRNGTVSATAINPNRLLGHRSEKPIYLGVWLHGFETGLRAMVKQSANASSFDLADASVEGRGLQPAFRDASWQQIRDTIYNQPA